MSAVPPGVYPLFHEMGLSLFRKEAEHRATIGQCSHRARTGEVQDQGWRGPWQHTCTAVQGECPCIVARGMWFGDPQLERDWSCRTACGCPASPPGARHSDQKLWRKDPRLVNPLWVAGACLSVHSACSGLAVQAWGRLVSSEMTAGAHYVLKPAQVDLLMLHVKHVLSTEVYIGYPAIGPYTGSTCLWPSG